MDRDLVVAGLSSLALAVALLCIEVLRAGTGPEIAAVASVGLAAVIVLGTALVDNLVREVET